MSLVNIISAIGNNSSVYPLLVRDCGIENPIKLGLTYKQNLKESREMANNALRERAIDEYVCSAIWLSGIPIMDKVCNWGIKKFGYDPNVDMSLFKDNSKQSLEKNIEKFKDLAKDEVESLKKVLANKKTYERLQARRFVLSTLIPVLLMGVALPKMNFALTSKLKKQEEIKNNTGIQDGISKENVSFKGNFVATLANMSTVNKMAVTDGGLTIGRVSTGRNRNERLELGFKMLGMMFLNFVAPKWIAKGFDSASNKLFNTNVNFGKQIASNILLKTTFAIMFPDLTQRAFLPNFLTSPASRACLANFSISFWNLEIDSSSTYARGSLTPSFIYLTPQNSSVSLEN